MTGCGKGYGIRYSKQAEYVEGLVYRVVVSGVGARREFGVTVLA